MAKITYANKQTAVDPANPSIPIEVFRPQDANEIKTSVNYLYDNPPIAQGIPTGGTTGKVLAKISDDDFDTGWVNQSSGGSDAEEAAFTQVLVFNTNKYMQHTQTGAINFSLDSGVIGKVISIKLTGNNANTITFDPEFKLLSGGVDNTKTNYIYLNYVADDDIRVTISFEGGGGGSVELNGDINVDEFGTARLGETPTAVLNNQIPYRNNLGNIEGNAGLIYVPTSGINTSYDISVTNPNPVTLPGHIIKSKARTTNIVNGGRVTGLTIENDFKASAGFYTMTGLEVLNKFDLNEQTNVVKDWLTVKDYDPNMNGGNGGYREKFIVSTDFNTGEEYFAGVGFRFQSNKFITGDYHLLVGNGYQNALFRYDFASIRGLRLGKRSDFFSGNAPWGTLHVDNDTDSVKIPAISFGAANAIFNQKVNVNNTNNPIKVATFSAGSLGAVFIYDFTLRFSTGYDSNNKSGYMKFVVGTKYLTDDGIVGTFALMNPSSPIDLIKEYKEEASWVITVVANNTTKELEIYFDKAVVGAINIDITAHAAQVN